jgi:hypothetical protein
VENKVAISRISHITGHKINTVKFLLAYWHRQKLNKDARRKFYAFLRHSGYIKWPDCVCKFVCHITDRSCSAQFRELWYRLFHSKRCQTSTIWSSWLSHYSHWERGSVHGGEVISFQTSSRAHPASCSVCIRGSYRAGTGGGGVGGGKV